MGKKLTPWFPGDVKPVHVGVYQRAYEGARVYCKWDGVAWLVYGTTKHQAAKRVSDSPLQHQPWRGLAEKPQ